jgi:hypothetical protein
MTDDEENAIINQSAADMVVRLEDGGKRPEAIVVVVLYKDDAEHHVMHMVHPQADPRLTDGIALLAASELIDAEVHERGLCEDCSPGKGTVQ